METVNARAGFLCNHEVLQLLRQQRDARRRKLDHLQDSKAKRLAKLDRKPFGREQEDEEHDRIQPQDLHTVTFECIKYLEEPSHPIRRQTTESISHLLHELEKLDLTKAERLQIVNLAPTTLVALVVCVEELEERFSTTEQQEHLLNLIRDHLGAEDAATAVGTGAAAPPTRKSGSAQQEEDLDEDTQAELDDMDDLIDEGTGQGAMEEGARDIDEEDA